MYGLPKVHKIGCPIRPILSALNTFNYNVAKWFVPILEPLTKNAFTVINSTQFVKEINNINIPQSSFLASFDVKSLFTNIPLVETVNLCVDLGERENLIPHDLTVSQFKALLDVAVKESVFIFNNKLYKQIDGVAMGSPLGPTLANVFLCYYEKIWLDSCPVEFKHIMY